MGGARIASVADVKPTRMVAAQEAATVLLRKLPMKRGVDQDLGSRVQLQTRDTEVMALLTWVAAVLVLATVLLSLHWFGRIT